MWFSYTTGKASLRLSTFSWVFLQGSSIVTPTTQLHLFYVKECWSNNDTSCPLNLTTFQLSKLVIT